MTAAAHNLLQLCSLCLGSVVTEMVPSGRSSASWPAIPPSILQVGAWPLQHQCSTEQWHQGSLRRRFNRCAIQRTRGQQPEGKIVLENFAVPCSARVPQSEVQVTHHFPQCEERGEVFGDTCCANFCWKKSTENLPPKIHHTLHSKQLKTSSPITSGTAFAQTLSRTFKKKFSAPSLYKQGLV